MAASSAERPLDLLGRVRLDERVHAEQLRRLHEPRRLAVGEEREQDEDRVRAGHPLGGDLLRETP